MTSPSNIAHYKITTKLGEGGMGAVYRATDTKLGRDDAIKVLPDSFANDHERLARFTREAQVLASLNHPNIAAIYGVEDRALILELVEGPTLADRLVHGAIPLEEALPIARQIAEGMEFAHERGIIHRDLKPSNIKIRDDGTVKLLDFGLAKAFSPDDASGSADLMNSPTLTGRATQLGVILGTAAYMSPEQAKGKPVDRRADIWAFGVVVYEMLAGKRGYQAEDMSDTLAAVLTREVDWTALPGETPARLRVLLHDCLARDPKQRLRDIGEARRVLDQLITGVGQPDYALSLSVATTRQTLLGRRVLPWAIAAIAVLGAIASGTLYLRHTNERPQEVRLQIVTPSGNIGADFGSSNALTLSPDGRSIVYGADTEDGKSYRLWLRPLDSEVAKPLPGTESPFLGTFWSPDSKWIGFFADKKLKRINVATGTVQTLADAASPRGGTWSADGTILFSPAGFGVLYRMPAAGGQPEPVTQLHPQEVTHRVPQFLPDGRHFLFWISGTPEVEGVYAGALDSHEYRKICVADGPAIFAPPAHLFFIRESVLYGQRFDPDGIKLSGEPIPVALGVSTTPYTGPMRFSASSNGTIAYRPDAVFRRQMTWLDRSGKAVGVVGEPIEDLQNAELSPDGRKLAVNIQRGAGKGSISLMDMARGTLTPLGIRGGATGPRWSPDGSKIAFGCVPRGLIDLCWKAVDSNGPGELLYASGEAKNLSDWSPDGKYILFNPQNPKTARDVMAVPVTGNDRQPIPVAQTPAEEKFARFSPDGKWVAYVSDETGRDEVFVRPFPGPGPAVRVSTGGGGFPFWRKDGKELYYRLGDQLLAVSVRTSASGAFEVGIPAPLFTAKGVALVRTDGQRFLFAMTLDDVSTPPITVIMNWAGLEK